MQGSQHHVILSSDIVCPSSLSASLYYFNNHLSILDTTLYILQSRRHQYHSAYKIESMRDLKIFFTTPYDQLNQPPVAVITAHFWTIKCRSLVIRFLSGQQQTLRQTRLIGIWNTIARKIIITP